MKESPEMNIETMEKKIIQRRGIKLQQGTMMTKIQYHSDSSNQRKELKKIDKIDKIEKQNQNQNRGKMFTFLLFFTCADGRKIC